MEQTTNFANSKRRMIRMSGKGVPFVMTSEGKKQYNPVAKFMKTPEGGLRVLTGDNKNRVPSAIAPSVIKGRKSAIPPPPPPPTGRKSATPPPPPPPPARKVRSNKGMKRGPREATLYRKVFGTPPPPTVRKVRSNKGMKRGPREATLYRMVFGTPPPTVRKVRSNKGMPRSMIVTPGGTTYKGKTAMVRRTMPPKKMAGNPFAELMMMKN